MGRHRVGGSSSKAGGDNAKEFHKHFSDIWGEARWTNHLKPALLQPSHLLALQNSFTQQDLGTDPKLVAWGCSDGCHTFGRIEDTGPYPQPFADARSGLAAWYWLDAASLLPPLLLDVKPGMSVLDMCASPGGKSLVIAQQLWRQGKATSSGPTAAAADAAKPNPESSTSPASMAGRQCSEPETSETKLQGAHAAAAAADDASTGLAAAHATLPAAAAPTQPGKELVHGGGALTCNEPDAKRRLRLQHVLQGYLPAALMTRVRITGHEGDKYWQRCEAEAYDRVLIDAPCSSDRHILQQSASTRGVIPEAYWSVKRCKQSADLQLQLLLAGLKALRVGGRLVYATCSMSTLENDDVIKRALARVGDGNVQVVSVLGGEVVQQEYLEKLGAEETRHGVICLPDRRGGWGPIYSCVLVKRASIGKTTIPVSVLAEPPAESDAEEEESDEKGEQTAAELPSQQAIGPL